jgi:enterochelin esterase family protein
MQQSALEAGPEVDARAVVLRVADPGRELAGVRLLVDRALGVERTDFDPDAPGWRLRVPRPPVARFEYRLELRRRDGRAETVPDPANPERAASAFGERSVVRFPDYRDPDWLGEAGVPGVTRALQVRAHGLAPLVPVRLWTPAAAEPGEPLPLLVAHDGAAYAELSGLTAFAAAAIGARRLPPHRLALLDAPERDEWYSASARYARALGVDVLAAVRAAVAVAGPVVGIGASLGALAMLHAHRRHPRAFGALFLQSGSYFHPRYDDHESGFRRYGRIVRFVRATLREPAPAPAPVPVSLTCGRPEENLRNNRLMADALVEQGYAARLHEVADLHNHTAWRDALHPHLTNLLGAAWATAS